MCGAGLSRRACGAVGDGVTVQGRALESCVPGAAAAHAGLAAVAIHAVALIWELARMDFLTLLTGWRQLFKRQCFSGS